MDYAPPPVQLPPRTSGMAIASLVLGICSFTCFLTGLPGLVLGIISLRQIQRSRGQLTGEGLAIGGIVTGGIGTILLLPIMIALLLPAIQAAREAVRRNQSMNNMKQLSLALQNYHDTRKGLPPSGNPAGANGAQLSWRVHILPFLDDGGAELYKEFHLDEPWDSPHNKALIARMPDVFKDPADRAPPGHTIYLAVTGQGTPFGDGTTQAQMADFKRGSSRTILIVEADPDQAAVWTKPEDWKPDANDPTQALGRAHPGGFLAAFGDASVKFIDNTTDPEAIRQMTMIDNAP